MNGQEGTTWPTLVITKALVDVACSGPGLDKLIGCDCRVVPWRKWKAAHAALEALKRADADLEKAGRERTNGTLSEEGFFFRTTHIHRRIKDALVEEVEK